MAEADSTAVQREGQVEEQRVFSPQSVHLLRTAQINTLTLSQMADQKASILIGATFVVFSLAVTRLIGEAITWSTLSLAATAFLSSLFAVASVLPSLGKPPKDQAMINPLFFGHFAAMEEDEWVESLLDRLATDEELFRTMLRDIHQNGRVLYHRKYRFLTLAYRIFLAGILITWLIYAAEFTLT
ncbi:Pycsar system effector family protein [Erythrobacter aurantius]|uniref:Pycsar system effector family protein n=1 Tax=Erythrobacter aurantius TaxID=2909249 RepID=UPI00207968F3|nr:Pycsar system effector family protein [Erythrobacter aurantius]